MKFNVIFPVAGEGSRFNYQFKPFIKLDDCNFIQHAMKYFIKNIEYVNKFYFICSKEQDDTYQVKDTIKDLFGYLNKELYVIVIDHKTPSAIDSV